MFLLWNSKRYLVKMIVVKEFWFVCRSSIVTIWQFFFKFNCTIFLLDTNLKHQPCFFFEIQRDILSKGLVSRIFVLYHIRNSALKCWQGRCRVTQGRHSLGIFLHFSTMMRFDKKISGDNSLKVVFDIKAHLKSDRNLFLGGYFHNCPKLAHYQGCRHLSKF